MIKDDRFHSFMLGIIVTLFTMAMVSFVLVAFYD